MIHLRGHKKDFDLWGNITNDPGWSWKGVLPYFKNYENYENLGDDGKMVYQYLSLTFCIMYSLVI